MSENSNGQTILVAEDNPHVLKLAEMILREKGFRVLSAEDGNRALEMLRDSTSPVHLLLTDLLMPEMNGRDLYKKAREIQEDITVVYMSGYTQDLLVENREIDPGAQFVQKPFTIDELMRQVQTALVTGK